MLEGGEEITARAVVSNADPRTTFLKLVDPVDLDPTFLLKIRNYRALGVSAKINLALSGLPSFPAINGDTSETFRPDSCWARHRLSRTRLRRCEVWRLFDRALPGHHDSIAQRRLARAEGRACDVDSRSVRALQVEGGDWNSRREEFADNVLNVLANYAPDLKS